MDKTTGGIVFIIHVISIVLFWKFGESKSEVKSRDSVDLAAFSEFQRIQCVVFLGIGLIAYEMKNTSFFMIIVAINYSILWDLSSSETLIHSFYKGVREALLVAITQKIVANKLSARQMLILILLEIPISKAICRIAKLLQVTDAGGTVSIHLFGSYFSLAVAKIVRRRQAKTDGQSDDALTHVGGIFLWIYWPSFNGLETASPLGSIRAVHNTYLSLVSCGVTTFALTSILGNFNRVRFIYATLAGGVAVGSVAQLILAPATALIIGTLSSIVTVLSFKYFQSHDDPQGIHNIHGLPSILGGFLNLLATATINEEEYQKEFYDIFPACTPREGTIELRQLYLNYLFVKPGDGRSIQAQVRYQLIYFVATFVFAVIFGVIIGLVLRYSPGLKSRTGGNKAENDDGGLSVEANAEDLHNLGSVV